MSNCTTTTQATEDQVLTNLIAKRDQARAEMQALVPATAAAYIETRVIQAAGLRASDPERVALTAFLSDAAARLSGQAA